jgi:hypothetical protein
VTNWNDVFFSLVPQRDRRQIGERRALGRGGRRAADMARALAAREAAILWSAPLAEAGHVAKKQIFHWQCASSSK